MKKNLILILLFLVHFNIFSQNQTEFENSFGIKNVKILNELIRDFEEDILSKNYSTLSTDKAYESYLNDYVGSQLSNKEFNTTVSIKKFNRSRIKSLIYCNIDTVYVGPSERAPEINIRAIITKYKCLDTEGKSLNAIIENYCCEKEFDTAELTKKLKTMFYINNRGLFVKSLKKVKNKSNFLKQYLERIEITNEIRQPLLMSLLILENHYNLNDYFLKRIILLNIVYRI